MQIDWWTLALQTVNFLVLAWLLARFLYRPVREVIEKRKELTEQAFTEADKVKEEAEAARRRFEDSRADLEGERQAMLRQTSKDNESEHGKVIEEARREAEELKLAARTAIATERETAIAEIRSQVTGLAIDLASKVLRGPGLEVPSDVFLQRIERKLKDLSDDERDRLKKDLAAEDARLKVVTVTPLESTDQKLWRTRLDASLGQGAKTDFVADPAIIGGVELHFPHARLKFTWADQLEKARGVLRQDENAS